MQKEIFDFLTEIQKKRTISSYLCFFYLFPLYFCRFYRHFPTPVKYFFTKFTLLSSVPRTVTSSTPRSSAIEIMRVSIIDRYFSSSGRTPSLSMGNSIGRKKTTSYGYLARYFLTSSRNSLYRGKS